MNLEEQRDELFRWLRAAFLLEFGTIPPYLTAMISLCPDANRTAAELIRAVAIEEMLHMTLVANVINSLNGKVSIGPDSIPAYPFEFTFEGKRFKDRKFKASIGAFTPEVLNIFMQIELPRDWPSDDHLLKMAVDHLDIDGLTIGAFYQKIIDRLERMCEEHGEKAVFCGDPAKQIGEDYYWSSGGKPVVVRDLESAKLALDTVVEQGEGTATSIYDDPLFGEPEELAHFFRFREIFFARRYKVGDKPHDPPTGEPFPVDFSRVYPMISNPCLQDYLPETPLARLNGRFNEEYTLMLIQLDQAFNGTPKALYTATANGMHNIASIAAEMARTPIPGDAQGRHGTPTFSWHPPEMP